MSTQNFFMPMVVIGLVVLTLIMSGLTRRYQQRQAARRSIVNRTETGIRLIEGLLQELKSFPLPFQLRQTLRQDVLHRYQMIGRIYRDYPQLEERLKIAQARCQTEPEVAPGNVMEVTDEPQVASLVANLDELSELVESPHSLLSTSLDIRKECVKQIGELRAELLSNFHMAQFARKFEAGDTNSARDHLRQLMTTLKARGPNTAKVFEFYERAEEEYNASMRRVVGDLPETVLKTG